MKITKTFIDGLLILETPKFTDERGSFQKLFNADSFKENELDTDFCELYFSISKKNTIRGMHFQRPPFDHTKLVYVSKGSIRDVVVDLRKKSETFGAFFDVELNDKDARYLYIPKGLAHGFLSLEDDTIVNYAQTSCHSKEHDSGIALDSFGFDWNTRNIIISERDKSFPGLDDFNSPF